MFVQTFDLENKQFETRKRMSSALIALLVEGLVVLICCFLYLRQHEPPYGGGGIAMGLGLVESAGGDNASTETFTDIQMSSPPSAPVKEADVKEKIATQNIEDAVAMPTNDKEKEVKKDVPKTITNPTKVDKPVQPQQPKMEDADIYKMIKNNAQKGNGQGNGTGPGVQGNPNGIPGSNGPGGNGGGLGNQGNGPGFGPNNGGGIDVVGRDRLTNPIKYNPCGVYEKVYLNIKINKAGKVTSAETAQGTTTTNSCLIEQAKKMAYQIQYSASDKGQESQSATIMIDFTAK